MKSGLFFPEDEASFTSTSSLMSRRVAADPRQGVRTVQLRRGTIRPGVEGIDCQSEMRYQLLWCREQCPSSLDEVLATHLQGTVSSWVQDKVPTHRDLRTVPSQFRQGT